MKHLIFVAALLLAYPCFGADATADCGLHGDARKGSTEYELNPLKNRSDTLADVTKAINPKITLASLLAPGDDQQRYSASQAARVTGYVVVVKNGGSESCNCHSSKTLDTHIALVADLADAKDGSKHLIIEVTPRLRQSHGNWTTQALLKSYLHKKVTVVGQLFFDSIHLQNAFNTNPHGRLIWRATCWEIHPVYSIQLAE